MVLGAGGRLRKLHGSLRKLQGRALLKRRSGLLSLNFPAVYVVALFSKG